MKKHEYEEKLELLLDKIQEIEGRVKIEKAELIDNIRTLTICAEDWMKKYQELKDKYEPEFEISNESYEEFKKQFKE